jgi:hypothetical protein
LVIYLQSFANRGFTFQVTDFDMPPVVDKPTREKEIVL